MVSELSRKDLAPVADAPRYRTGIRLMPVRPDACPMTLDEVHALRGEAP